METIFQSSKTKDHSKISDLIEELNDNSNYISSLDDQFTMEELNTAIKMMGTGVKQTSKKLCMEIFHRTLD